MNLKYKERLKTSFFGEKLILSSFFGEKQLNLVLFSNYQFFSTKKTVKRIESDRWHKLILKGLNKARI